MPRLQLGKILQKGVGGIFCLEITDRTLLSDTKA